ncbi:MAG: P-loop NTPase [Candidatus Marinimicrobia bacterium]|nr:P-loop NTPase [Candidatus Neomarinimicrobiota bacterium]MCF7880519.1 P-loop NTPase [Candidatus Neomarinimicrobiota bacterium]
MNGQATALREYIRRKNLGQVTQERDSSETAAGQVVTVSSGKGGVGKSTIALHLALRTEARALVIDGDFVLGDLATLLNLTPSGDWTTIFKNPKSWPRYTQPVNDSTDVLVPVTSGRETAQNLPYSSRITRLLHQWRENYELIIIDTATGLAAQVIDWCLAANRVMVVTTPDPAACTDAYALIKALHLTNRVRDIGLVVNQFLPEDDPDDVFNQIETMTKRFLDYAIVNYGTVPWSHEIITASRSQAPLKTFHEGDALSLPPFDNAIGAINPGTQAADLITETIG